MTAMVMPAIKSALSLVRLYLGNQCATAGSGIFEQHCCSVQLSAGCFCSRVNTVSEGHDDNGARGKSKHDKRGGTTYRPHVEVVSAVVAETACHGISDHRSCIAKVPRVTNARCTS